MTVHQKCYGVLIIPEEDWICHLCKAFNDMNVCNNMECILCPNVGGAMKPCTLKKSSHSYKLMIKNRKSPNLKDNNNKNNYKNNNNLKNSIFFIDKNKNGKKKEINNHNNYLNSNINNNSDNNVTEKNIFFSDISQTPNIVNLISSNNINANNSINNSIYNNSDNNSNQQINNSIQSYRSSNLNKETESLYSNSSSIKINEDITNITNPINNKNNHLLKKQIKLKSQNEIYLSDKIAKENAWVHLSCALWLPELNIVYFDIKEKIKGVENLPKKRFQETCNICLKIGYGPTIKCEKCDYYFHPECARRLRKFVLEINENENGETTFLAYCNKDAPPNHLKKYELIKQRKKDEIKKVSNLIQKDINSLNKIPEDKQCNIYFPYCNSINNNEIKKMMNEEKKVLKKMNKLINLSDNNNSILTSELIFNDSVNKSINNSIYDSYDKNIELTNTEKINLINAIRETLIEQSNLTLEINTKDYSVKQRNNFIRFTFEDMTYPEKFSWCFLKENQDYLNGISNYEIFKIYRSIIITKDDFITNILREKINFSEKPKKNKNKIKIKPIPKVQKEEEYCICHKRLFVDYIGCDNKNGKCPGKTWYHLSCIPELKNFTSREFEQYFDKYYCPQCRELFHLKNVIRKKISNNNNVSISNNQINTEMKKGDKNVIVYDKFQNNEQIIYNHKDSKGECPMEIEEFTKEENKQQINKII
jgi:hypothetical protein